MINNKVAAGRSVIAILIFQILFISSCSKGERGRTLIIGDSNGAMPDNWVIQLHKLRPSDSICNLSISGNTIGFKNNGQDTLNTLLNIEGYLHRGEKELGRIDRIIFLIGTNDCKAVFDSLKSDVPVNLERLVIRTVDYFKNSGRVPEIILVTPPPMAVDSLLAEKYQGGEERIKNLIPAFREVAERNSLVFINIYDSLAVNFQAFNADGVHLNEKGYKKVGEIINRSIKLKSQQSVLGIIH